MLKLTRDAGAFCRTMRIQCLLVVLAWASIAPPLAAADVRLLRAREATIQSDTLNAPADGLYPLRLRLQAGSEIHELRLRPNTRLGTIAELTRGRAQAWEGDVAGRPGSWAALTRIGTRWTGLWFDGANHHGIDDAGRLAAASTDAASQPPGRQMIFNLRDALLEDISFHGDTLLPGKNEEQTAQSLADKLGGELGIAINSFAALPDRRLMVALLADRDLSRQDGSETEANLLAQLNIVDGIFAAQVGVRVGSGSVTRFGNFSDPFTSTRDAETLLQEVRSYRAGSALQKSAGLTHLVTGRNLSGRTVGIAYQGALCNSGYSASLSQGTMSVSFAALVMAHELGHVFGAPHDGEEGSACMASPESFLMARQLNGSQSFSSCSLDQMATRLVAASCLVPADAPDAALEGPERLSLALGRATEATIAIRSLGNVGVTVTSLRIALPPWLQVLQASAPSGECTRAGSTLFCPVGTLLPGTLGTVTLRVQADAPASATASLRLFTSDDVVAANDTTSIQLVAETGADLATTLTAGRTTMQVGGQLSAMVMLENRGPAAVQDATLAVTLPAGLSLTNHVAGGISCTAQAGRLECGPVALAAGSNAQVQLQLQAIATGTATIGALGASTRAEQEPGNESAQLAISISAPPRLGSQVSGGGGGGSVPPIWLAALALAAAAATRRRLRAARLDQARAKYSAR